MVVIPIISLFSYLIFESSGYLELVCQAGENLVLKARAVVTWWCCLHSPASAGWRWRSVAAAPAAPRPRRQRQNPRTRLRLRPVLLRHRPLRGSNTPGRRAPRSERLALLSIVNWSLVFLRSREMLA